MDRSGANEDTYPMLVISRLITVTYLPIFSEMGRGSTQEPPCRPFELFIVLHCCRNLALFYFILFWTSLHQNLPQKVYFALKFTLDQLIFPGSL